MRLSRAVHGSTVKLYATFEIMEVKMFVCAAVDFDTPDEKHRIAN